MARQYWRIGTDGNADIFRDGYPYIWADPVNGYSEKNGKKEKVKRLSILNLSKVRIGDIIVAGGRNRIDYIGEVIEKPTYLLQCYGPAWDASFEDDPYHINEADDEIKEIFNETFEDEDKPIDVVGIKTAWYKIDKGLWMPEAQPPGSFNGITNQKVIRYINAQIRKSDRSQQMKDWVNILKTNKNIIFTGAPGTGKTFLAREIASLIVGKENEESNTDFVQFHPSYDYTDFVEGLRPVDKGNMQIGFRLEDGTFKRFCRKAIKESNNDFVFIIDEINRGEIAKIFGELFFCLDPGYRGEKGKVKTQYDNLIPEGDKFKKVFFIPENVYIIGTMNDIDRSVESFDFAMRRRFTWIEIKASDTADEMFRKQIPQYREEALQRLNALNDAISDDDIGALNESYHIGGAYFLKLKEHEGDYEKLWTYHLLPLLQEYFRGTDGSMDKLEKLKAAYDLSPAENNGGDDAQDEGL